MKKIWIVLLILLLLVIVFFTVLVFTKKKTDNNKITIEFMHFSYSTSTMMNGNVIYEINYKEGKYIASIKPNNKSEEETLEVKLSDDDIEKIKSILNKYNVSSWNKFSKHDKDVLDGNGFSFSLRTQEGKEIIASGYMKWPTNYGNVRGELDAIFDELYNSNYMKGLTYLYFSYSGGDEANSNTIYSIKKDDNKYTLTVKLYGEPKEVAKDYEVDEEFIKKVEAVLNKYNVSSWNGFKRYDKNVLDGDSFNFSAELKDKKIEASGYESWPTNYGKVKDELKKNLTNN